ncbi:MAG: lytic transglycosylase domain-containing protein [Firmicutes bacterium]|nr:lytic transglycosylase domain-containing protein [Bacillota bacterium]
MADWVRRLWLPRLLLVLALAVLLLFAVMRTPRYLRRIYPYHHRQLIELYAFQYGVDPLLVVAVMHAESNFRVDAVSWKGALGLMQVIPETAQWIARRLGMETLEIEDILDPEVNIRLGTWYLAYLLEKFAGRVDVVIAAYNAGPGQVSAWLDDKTWSGRYADRHKIPFAETRQFLVKVRKAYTKYQQLYR